MKRAIVCLALAGCQPASVSPAPVAPSPARASEPAPDSAPSTDEPRVAASQSEPDITIAAAHEGIVFMRTEDFCEVWQFDGAGARIETVADERLGLRFSFAVQVRDPKTVTLTDPQAVSRGTSTEVDCPDEPGRTDLLFLEEGDCDDVERGIEIERGCPSSLIDPERRAEALHRLEAGRREVFATRLAAAEERVAAFDKAVRRSKAVFWPVDDDGKASCEKWVWRKAKRRGDNDALVRSDRGGGKTMYGMYASTNERKGTAEVNLMGPHSEASSIMGWEIEPLSEVTDQYAVVGTKRWYFSAAACRASLGSG